MAWLRTKSCNSLVASNATLIDSDIILDVLTEDAPPARRGPLPSAQVHALTDGIRLAEPADELIVELRHGGDLEMMHEQALRVRRDRSDARV